MMRIAIAGAGIAGLSVALALQAAGAEVMVFEAASSLNEAGAGLQLSPNATRVLRDLGLLDVIAATAVKPAQVRLRRGSDGAELAALPLGAAAERRYGAPFLVAHRADLQAALLDAVRRSPAIVLTTGRSVDGVDTAGAGVTLRFTDGTRLAADGLVGADGLHSAVRRFVAPAAGPFRFGGRTAWRSLLSAEAAPAFAREASSTLWLGPGAHLVHYPVRSGALVNVVAIVEDHRAAVPTVDDWAATGDPDRLLAAFAGWCEPVRALLRAGADWRIWPLGDRAPLAQWSRGAVTLAGDAAHPMLPFLAQGAAQAIEDAAAIGRAIRAKPSFAAAATAYERARKARAHRVQRESRRQAAIYHLDPPFSLARDAAFRLLGPARMLARYDWLYGA